MPVSLCPPSCDRTRHVDLQSQKLAGTDTLTQVMTMEQTFSLEKKNRLNTNLLKSYVVIAAEIKEASQQMIQSDKLVHNTQIKSKHNAPQLLWNINPLNPELNPICYLLALLGAHNFLHVSRIRVKSLTFRRLTSYIYMEHPFLMFLDHTRRTTVGRTPLDE